MSAVGEFGLIERFRSKLPLPPSGESWSGDDAAVLRSGDGWSLVTVDVLVEGIDFDLGYGSPEDVGWKALTVNVSDIAAMAGTPTHAVAALSLPSGTPTNVADGILDGMLAASERWNVALVGGDVSAATEISIAVTLLGRAQEPVLRSGARVGDAICVTGSLGGAAAGLMLLRSGGEGASGALVSRQLRPMARVEEGIELERAGATALIDISDGFVGDLVHVLDASGVGCDVDPAAVPVDPGIASASLEVDPLELALTGGEDFELLVTLPSEAAAQLGHVVTRVGTVTESERRIGGRSLEEWKDKAWDHLRDR